MKIIKRGVNPEAKPKEITCFKCKSILEYLPQDVQQGQYGFPIITCPVCGQYLEVSNDD